MVSFLIATLKDKANLAAAISQPILQISGKYIVKMEISNFLPKSYKKCKKIKPKMSKSLTVLAGALKAAIPANTPETRG